MNEHRIRGLFITGGFFLVFVIYLFRLLFLQVMSQDYALKSDEKDLKNIVLLPSRGIIVDRNNKVFVQNTPVFDIVVVPKNLYIPDTSIITEHLGLSAEEINSRISKYKGIARYQPQILEKQVDARTAAKFQEHLWRFSGVSIEARNTREYLYQAGAAFLGYINQVSQSDLDNDETGYYRSGDLIGISGIERSYETILRGEKGSKTILVDAFNREVARYAEGKLDEAPIEGRDIKISVDAELQVLGEKLMRNKRGSIVAIEPSTGEILAFVSAPTFDPNLFTGRDLGKNYQKLVADTTKPLFSRPLMAMYPPGSIFKILQALAGMAEGTLNENTHFPCSGAWFRNRGKPHCHGAHGSVGLKKAIVQSCNPFFAENYYQILENRKYRDIHDSFNAWRGILLSYGIGQKLGIDIPNEQPGNLPTAAYYDKYYGKKGWSSLTIFSNSIGMGEILMTPLQMANEAVLVANRGHYFKPHFLVAERESDGSWTQTPYQKIVVPGSPQHYNVVVDAMEEVVQAGTGTRARLDSIVVCGKTGTVENRDAEDHAVFIAFAPKENPRIAIGVFVENAGFGGTWSAPIASLMIEYYLTREIKDEGKLKRILDAKFLTPWPQLAVQ